MLIARASRAGVTLVELIVSLVVGGVVLGIVAGIGARQQRLYGDVGRRIMGQEQLRHAGAILPIDLRTVSAVAGDIAPGEARDTSLELRATIGTSLVCDAAGPVLILLGAAPGGEVGAFADVPRPGDSLWVLDESAADERWRAFAVLRASQTDRPCAASFPPSLDTSAAGRAPRLEIDTGQPTAGTVAIGAPVRLTRRARYSFYRGADGEWYLGYRDWNGALDRFNQVQPVSGPYLPPARGVGFRYFDRAGMPVIGAGVPLDGDSTAAPTIARVDLVLRAVGRSTLGAAGSRAASPDSTIVSVALRNRW